MITRMLAGLLTGALVVGQASAQPDGATLAGVIFDPTNRLVPGTSITLSDPGGTRPARKTTSDGQGHYEFVNVPAGRYRMQVEQAGFRTITSEVQVNGKTEQSFRLAVGTLREEITVSITADEGRPPRAAATGSGPSAEARQRDRDTLMARQCAPGTLGRIGGLIVPPQKTRHVNPAYPDDMREARLTATVAMRAKIATDGSVTDLVAVEGTHQSFVTAAAVAVNQWRFLPTMLDCEPVAVDMQVFVTFTRGR